jgi:hypothetical protein
MPSGWIRWLLERFEFPFEVVYPPQLDEGNLKSKYDVLIFLEGAIPGRGGRFSEGYSSIGDGGETNPQGFGQGMPNRADVPAEYQNRLGNITVDKTIPQLRKFMEEGGTILAIGNSTSMGYYAELPLVNHSTEKFPDGSERPLPREKFYVPGSILQVRMDNSHPLAYGMPDRADVFFDNSPVFRLLPEAALKGVRPVAWFDSAKPLRSGWAWGEGYLAQGVAVVEAEVGKGKLCLFGPEITFRGQPHGTFKLLFNGIYYGSAEPKTLP